MLTCTYCGRPADTVDHITPRSYGGTDDATNLTPACRDCNSDKGTLPAELFGADWRTIRDWLIARGWTPITGRSGRRSNWRSPNSANKAWYSRDAAIHEAAYGDHRTIAARTRPKE